MYPEQMTLDEFAQCLWICGKFLQCDNFRSCESCPAYTQGNIDNLKDTYDVIFRTLPFYGCGRKDVSKRRAI